MRFILLMMLFLILLTSCFMISVIKPRKNCIKIITPKDFDEFKFGEDIHVIFEGENIAEWTVQTNPEAIKYEKINNNEFIVSFEGYRSATISVNVEYFNGKYGYDEVTIWLTGD